MFGGGAKKEKKEEEDRGDNSGSAKAQREAAAASKPDEVRRVFLEVATWGDFWQKKGKMLTCVGNTRRRPPSLRMFTSSPSST